MRVEYRIEPCKSALTQVRGMPFKWSLNPYMGCVHRCTFCYVRHFEQRAARPSDDRYGRSIRVKPNIAEVLRRELARGSWERNEVALGTATDPYQPAEGRFRLTRACLVELDASWTPYSIVTRGPLRSEEHTSELQSRLHLVCRLLLEKKNARAESRSWRPRRRRSRRETGRTEAWRSPAARGRPPARRRGDARACRKYFPRRDPGTRARSRAPRRRRSRRAFGPRWPARARRRPFFFY